MASAYTHTHTEKPAQTRNYNLDALKFLLSIFVFIQHTAGYVGENTRYIGKELPIGVWGNWSVQFFFLISGMMMVNSFFKRRPVIAAGDEGECTFNFLMRKVKSLMGPYLTAFLLSLIASSVMWIKNGTWTFVHSFLRFISVFFGVHEICGFPYINGVTWYIIAMLFAMIPLYYILCKNPKFYVYVLSPILALSVLGYMYNVGFNGSGKTVYAWLGICVSGVMRAVGGLCFGAIAYIIYDKVFSKKMTSRQRVLITVVEVISYAILLGMLIFKGNDRAFYPIYTLAPLAIAITFSGQSYISELFRFRWMRFFEPLSLAIYLTHVGVGNTVTTIIFPEGSYKLRAGTMVLVTAISCVVYFGIIRLAKFLYPRIVKFLKEEKTKA